MLTFDKTIAFIGAGNMASAIIGGLVEQGVSPQQIVASDLAEQQLAQLYSRFGVRNTQSNADAVKQADVVILSVKPQIMHSVCDSLAQAVPDIKDKLVISIAAGISIERLQQSIPGLTRVIRTMPNTPAQIGKGCTGLYAPEGVSEQDKHTATQLLNAVGQCVWLTSEHDINAVIAASGSAPAYFFLMMEAMQASAEKMGLTPEQAKALVTQAAVGSCMLAEHSSEDFATLRAKVTSKGGTTHAAIEQFKAGGMESLVDEAMQAAVARAIEMEASL